MYLIFLKIPNDLFSLKKKKIRFSVDLFLQNIHNFKLFKLLTIKMITWLNHNYVMLMFMSVLHIAYWMIQFISLAWSSQQIGRMRTPVREAFSYGIRHVSFVIHWTMRHSSLNNNTASVHGNIREIISCLIKLQTYVKKNIGLLRKKI